MCVDIDSAFVPPAGYFLFSPAAGGSISPDYVDCGTGDVLIALTQCSGPPPPPPIALCQPVTVNAGADCKAAASINNGSTGSQIVLTQTPPGPYDKGVTSVLLTVTDSLGRTDTCRANVTVQDVTKPTITCPANIVKNNDPGLCSAVATFAPVAADNCPGVGVISTPPSGFAFPVGVTTVWSVATDASGNKDSCSFTVTVNDPPKVTGIPDQSVLFGADFTPITLDNFVNDPCYSANEMTWTYSGNTNLLVAISPSRVATITKPNPTWSGSELITFTATNPRGFTGSDTARFTVAGPGGVIKVTPDTLKFLAFTAGTNPDGKGVMITNLGTGTLDWIAAKDSSWLTLSSTSGTAPSGFTVNIDITGKLAGLYRDDVTISSIQATNSPQKLVVLLQISNAVDIKLTPDSLDFYSQTAWA